MITRTVFPFRAVNPTDKKKIQDENRLGNLCSELINLPDGPGMDAEAARIQRDINKTVTKLRLDKKG